MKNHTEKLLVIKNSIIKEIKSIFKKLDKLAVDGWVIGLEEINDIHPDYTLGLLCNLYTVEEIRSIGVSVENHQGKSLDLNFNQLMVEDLDDILYFLKKYIESDYVKSENRIRIKI